MGSEKGTADVFRVFCFSRGELTYVILMVDDGVERNILPLQVPLHRLHVVGALVALDEAVKLTIHEGTVSQGSLLTWEYPQKKNKLKLQQLVV